MRTVYLDNTTGTASPTDPTLPGDPYNSFANLVSGESAVTDDLTIECSGGDLGPFDSNGMSANTITVNMEANSPTYNTSWCRIKATDATTLYHRGGQLMTINNGLVELARSADGTKQCVIVGGTGSKLVFNKGFIISSGTITTGENRGVFSDVVSADCVLYNAIIVNFDVGSSDSSYGLRGISSSDDGYELYNCIIYNNGVGAQTDNAANKFINCVFGSNNHPTYGDLRGNSGTIDYNAAEDTEADGPNGVLVADVSALYTDPANLDFSRVSADGDDLNLVGQDDPASGAFSDDISGNARTSTWDIGPEEFDPAPLDITSPTSITAEAATTFGGVDLDTVTSVRLQTSDTTYTSSLTIDAQTSTTLDVDASTGIFDSTTATDFSGVPVDADVLAIGASDYVLEAYISDGTNERTLGITLNSPSGYTAVQTMISEANTSTDSGAFDSAIIAVEDDMQCVIPTTVGSTTLGWAADGSGEITFSSDSTISFDAAYFSPATGQWSKVAMTWEGGTIIVEPSVSGELIRPIFNALVKDFIQ